MSNEQEITPEQYKAEVLKQNFARRCADYEDVIASLQTQVAMLQQQLKAQQGADDAESPPDELPAPAPPAPPAE